MKLTDLHRPTGTFVGVRLTSRSIAQLQGWMDQNLLDHAEPAETLHTTLVISKDKPIAIHPLKYDPVVLIDPSTYEIELFGDDKDVMVLSFDSEFLQARHMQLRQKYNLSWDFPEYNPHITLSYTPQEIQTDLEPPTFEIELEREYVEEFGNYES